MIVVREPGLLTTVQDAGRAGCAHLGVPRAGAVDAEALRTANRLVGNDISAAGLEATLIGPTLLLEADTVVAVTGGRCRVTLDDRQVQLGGPVTASRGETLVLGPVERGVRSYLAVLGGIDVPPVLGSRSTCTLSGLGPPPLRAGDRLPVGRLVDAAVALPALLPEIEDRPVLRLHPGPRADAFAPGALEALTASSYQVLPASDRVGVRLQGPRLQRGSDDELPSEGVVPGAVQVPPDGQPIVFLANCPTTGGYPVIGVVDPRDLRHAAQARAGTSVAFRPA